MLEKERKTANGLVKRLTESVESVELKAPKGMKVFPGVDSFTRMGPDFRAFREWFSDFRERVSLAASELREEDEEGNYVSVGVPTQEDVVVTDFVTVTTGSDVYTVRVSLTLWSGILSAGFFRRIPAYRYRFEWTFAIEDEEFRTREESTVRGRYSSADSLLSEICE